MFCYLNMVRRTRTECVSGISMPGSNQYFVNNKISVIFTTNAYFLQRLSPEPNYLREKINYINEKLKCYWAINCPKDLSISQLLCTSMGSHNFIKLKLTIGIDIPKQTKCVLIMYLL